VPLQIVVDNAKPVVLERSGERTTWHPVYADFAGYYGFTPWAHWFYRPQTKGKVESGVSYVERNALAGKRFGSSRIPLRFWKTRAGWKARSMS
jgi:transposase